MKKFVHLGECRKVHGIKGGLTFSLANSESSILKNGMKIYLSKDEKNFLVIRDINFANKVICYLEGICDRNEAEALIPFEIYVDRADFPVLDEGEFYLSDLVGFEVMNEKGKRVGVVNGFYNHGASEIISIKLKNDDDLELPFVDAFFPEVNLKESIITMINPEIV